MNIVFLHYHLNRGGVTRVIESHLRALANGSTDSIRLLVLHGGRAADWDDALPAELMREHGERVEISVRAIPSLDYDDIRESPDAIPAAKTNPADALLDLLSPEFPADDTILHIHNHCLGKNHQIAATVKTLAEHGYRILLHVHDFAEDLRPNNYRHLLTHADSLSALQASLYPLAEQIHYATLNQRDAAILTSAGIPSERIHRLPNPVSSTFGDESAREERRNSGRRRLQQLGLRDEPYVLYPVRPIRRKNISELLLWSLLLHDATFGISLAPLNPREVQDYEFWKQRAAELNCRILFETGSALTLEENYAAADGIITTSVAEGFGLVFLEASLAGLPLMGRDLPGITDDFYGNGIQLPGLQTCLHIPTTDLPTETYRAESLRLIGELNDSFGLPAANDKELTAQINSALAEPTIDFARLDRTTRNEILTRAARDTGYRAALREANPHITLSDESRRSLTRAAQRNRAIVADRYSLSAIGQQLLSIYQALLTVDMSQVTCHSSTGRSVISSFVQPGRVFPCRLE